MNLSPFNGQVYAFNSHDPISVSGKFSAMMQSTNNSVPAEFLVVNNETTLLGFPTASQLGIIQIANRVSTQHSSFQRHLSLFTGFGKMKDVEIKLHIDENFKPVSQLHLRIPLHQRKSL